MNGLTELTVSTVLAKKNLTMKKLHAHDLQARPVIAFEYR